MLIDKRAAGGDWKVREVFLTSDAKRFGKHAHYKFHVRGILTTNGEEFAWSVPDVSNPRFDLSEAKISEDAAVLI